MCEYLSLLSCQHNQLSTFFQYLFLFSKNKKVYKIKEVHLRKVNLNFGGEGIELCHFNCDTIEEVIGLYVTNMAQNKAQLKL